MQCLANTSKVSTFRVDQFNSVLVWTETGNVIFLRHVAPSSRDVGKENKAAELRETGQLSRKSLRTWKTEKVGRNPGNSSGWKSDKENKLAGWDNQVQQRLCLD